MSKLVTAKVKLHSVCHMTVCTVHQPNITFTYETEHSLMKQNIPLFAIKTVHLKGLNPVCIFSDNIRI